MARYSFKLGTNSKQMKYKLKWDGAGDDVWTIQEIFYY
jgi:hypothetical protein